MADKEGTNSAESPPKTSETRPTVADETASYPESPWRIRRGQKPWLLELRSAEWLVQLCVGYGVFVDLCIYGIAAPVIPFRLRELGYENVESLTGWLVAAYAGGLIVSSPPIGYLGERIENRQGPLLFALLFMAGSLVMFMLSESFALLLISRILQGFSGTGIFTLGFALLADCVPEERVALAFGNAMIGLSLGGFAGPPIGGALYRKLGYYAPWIFSICLVAVDFLLRIFIIEPKYAAKWIKKDIPAHVLSRDSASVSSTSPSPLRAFLSLSYNGRAITSMLVSFALGIYFGGVLDGGMTLKLNDRYGLNSLGAGLVFMANGIPAFIFSPLAGWLTDHRGQRIVLLVGLVGLVITVPLLCIDRMNLAAFCAVLALIGTAMAIPAPPIGADLAELTRETPGLGYAHSYSMFNISFSLGSFIGPIASGQLLQHLGITNGWYTIVAIAAFCYLACLPFVFWKYPHTKKKAAQTTQVIDEELVNDTT